jgi:outer membrane murein-binding lipoprotein Lpp
MEVFSMKSKIIISAIILGIIALAGGVAHKIYRHRNA